MKPIAFGSANCLSDQDSTPIESAEQALDDIMQFDHINLALDRSWGVLSHLNSVMSNDDIRHVHHELLPMLSAYGTRVERHKPLFERYQQSLMIQSSTLSLSLRAHGRLLWRYKGLSYQG